MDTYNKFLLSMWCSDETNVSSAAMEVGFMQEILEK